MRLTADARQAEWSRGAATRVDCRPNRSRSIIDRQRIALIGNHLPRRCGIATFTHDLNLALVTAIPGVTTGVIAMTEAGGSYDYPACVQREIRADEIADYREAATFLNTSGMDVVSLQHEFGIFGGQTGSHIVELIRRLEVPLVTTLHTVLAEPSEAQRRVMQAIIEGSARTVVMSAMGRDILSRAYRVDATTIDVIAHGIPDVPFQDSQPAKARFGLSSRTVILTFGLLSPSKGIETAIDAMPAIISACPSAIYVILGATHPNLVREQGEDYRESLVSRVRDLGIESHVLFFDQFVDQATLLQFIAMCDVYVTPYLNEAQMTSGTLAYSFGSGKAIVSTPYWHANELLADGRGILVPFGDSEAIGREIAALLGNDVRRHAMRKQAYAASRSMTWAQTATRYHATFSAAISGARKGIPIKTKRSHGQPTDDLLPQLRFAHLQAMSDSTGLMQHAIHSIPDRSHGYCVDDNARALLLACTLDATGEVGLPDILTTRFAAFVAHAWNDDTRRFRNFMGYDRTWLEPRGSEDSHGRTLWALAACAAGDADATRRRWAIDLFRTALPSVAAFTSPRAWAFTLLALDHYCPLARADIEADRLRRRLAERLVGLLAANRREGWCWFEDVLGYDNARLSEGLIRTGLATGTASYTSAGLETLCWLMDVQTSPLGCFRPVGSHSFGKRHARPEPFDQQPVEVAASVSACLAAASDQQHGAGPDWEMAATSAFNWFLGENDLRVTVADRHSGACLDGLHPDRPNRNMGAESMLSYLLALAEMRNLARLGKAPDKPAPAIHAPATA